MGEKPCKKYYSTVKAADKNLKAKDTDFKKARSRCSVLSALLYFVLVL